MNEVYKKSRLAPTLNELSVYPNAGLILSNTTQKLQCLYTKFYQAQNPGRSLDPLEFLPLELAQMVIENLCMRDRVYECNSDEKVMLTYDKNLSRCQQVMETVAGVLA